MSYRQLFINSIAEVMLLDQWQPHLMMQRVFVLLNAEPVWVKPLVNRIYNKFVADYPNVSQQHIIDFISNDESFYNVLTQQRDKLQIRQFNLDLIPPPVSKVACKIPELKSIKNLADWLELNIGQLENYAAHWRVSSQITEVRYRHYHYHWKQKKGGKQRLIEAPKQRLATAQKKIYQDLLAHIPLHDACHGFRKEHSCLSYAAPHAGKKVVLHMDLAHFFNHIQIRRIHALFVTVGYSESVADRLAGLCCHQTPIDVLAGEPRLSWQQRKLLTTPHLPQGSPSSPALANLCAYKLDCRLAALAKKLGGEYSRYADDLAFSGDSDFAKKTNQLPIWVASIAIDEGFSVNHRKTQLMHQGVSQRLVGLTLNQFPNYPRYEYDQLKALLFNCTKSDPETQNRQQLPNFHAHLQGKIAYVRSLNPSKAEKLDSLYKKINW